MRANARRSLAPAHEGLTTRRRRAELHAFVAETDTAPRQIVRGHLHDHPIADPGADAELPHLARRIGEDLMVVVELDAEVSVRKDFGHHAVKLEKLFFRHMLSLEKGNRTAHRPALWPILRLLTRVEERHSGDITIMRDMPIGLVRPPRMRVLGPRLVAFALLPGMLVARGMLSAICMLLLGTILPALGIFARRRTLRCLLRVFPAPAGGRDRHTDQFFDVAQIGPLFCIAK